MNTLACIDNGAGTCALNSAWVDKMNFKSVKCMKLSVKVLTKSKCKSESCDELVELTARKITAYAAVIKLSQFGENVVLGNDVLDALKSILDFCSKLQEKKNIYALIAETDIGFQTLGIISA